MNELTELADRVFAALDATPPRNLILWDAISDFDLWELTCALVGEP